MARTIVLTRPAPHIGEGLSGFSVLHLPTLQVTAHVDSIFEAHLRAQWPRYDGVMLVSQYAAHFACERLHDLNLSWPTTMWAAVVGQGSFDAVHQYLPHIECLKPMANDTQDSEGLWRTLQPRINASSRVLIVRAQTGRDVFAQHLIDQGASVDVWPCYQRSVQVWTAGQKTSFRVALTQGLVIVMASTEGLHALLANLSELTEAERSLTLQQPVLTHHDSIAQKAHALGFSRVRVAAMAHNEQALIELASSD